MLHPVGELPAVVYWRRRALLAGLLVALLVGGGWIVVSAVAGGGESRPVAASASAAPALAAPSLEQVVPSLAAVEVPTDEAETPAAEVATTVPAAPAPPLEPEFTEGQACSDEMIDVDVRPTPAQAPVGSQPTFDLLVTNTSPVSCTRALDAGLREIVLIDGGGNRLWGSNDCYPEASSEPRTLAVGEQLAFPVLWSGLTSDPECAAPRVNPAPGQYQLQGRLDTKVGSPARLDLV